MPNAHSRRLEDLSGPEIAERINRVVGDRAAGRRGGAARPAPAAGGGSCDRPRGCRRARRRARRRLRSVAAAHAVGVEVERARLVAGDPVAVGGDVAGSTARHRPQRRRDPRPAVSCSSTGTAATRPCSTWPCREIRLSQGLMTFLVHPFVPADHGGTSPEAELGMGIQGGHQETSVFMHLRPDLVHLERAGRAVPEGLARNRHVRFGGLASVRLALQRLRPAWAHRRPDRCQRGGGQAALRDRGDRCSASRWPRSPPSTSAAVPAETRWCRRAPRHERDEGPEPKPRSLSECLGLAAASPN